MLTAFHKFRPKCHLPPNVSILVLVVPVLKSDAACAPWLAAAAGADAAGRTTPVAVGMRSGSRRGGAAGEKEGLCLHTQGATDLTAPGHLE